MKFMRRLPHILQIQVRLSLKNQVYVAIVPKVDAAKTIVNASEQEENALLSAVAPIVTMTMPMIRDNLPKQV
jgi:hypothetical protein